MHKLLLITCFAISLIGCMGDFESQNQAEFQVWQRHGSSHIDVRQAYMACVDNAERNTQSEFELNRIIRACMVSKGFSSR